MCTKLVDKAHLQYKTGCCYSPCFSSAPRSCRWGGGGVNHNTEGPLWLCGLKFGQEYLGEEANGHSHSFQPTIISATISAPFSSTSLKPSLHMSLQPFNHVIEQHFNHLTISASISATKSETMS